MSKSNPFRDFGTRLVNMQRMDILRAAKQYGGDPFRQFTTCDLLFENAVDCLTMETSSTVRLRLYCELLDETIAADIDVTNGISPISGMMGYLSVAFEKKDDDAVMLCMSNPVFLDNLSEIATADSEVQLANAFDHCMTVWREKYGEVASLKAGTGSAVQAPSGDAEVTQSEGPKGRRNGDR